jgi:hypothetical protein
LNVSESPHFLKKLEALTHSFAEEVRCQFSQEIAYDAKAVKKIVLRLVRSALPPRRGRTNDPRIDAAVQMSANGKSVKEILRIQIPGFDKLDSYGRYLAVKGLHAAVARRRKRHSGTSGPKAGRDLR